MLTLVYQNNLKSAPHAGKTVISSKCTPAGEGASEVGTPVGVAFCKLKLLTFFSTVVDGQTVLALKTGKASAIVFRVATLADGDSYECFHFKSTFDKNTVTLPWSYELFLGERPTLLQQPMPTVLTSEYNNGVVLGGKVQHLLRKVVATMNGPLLNDGSGAPIEYESVRFKNVAHLGVFSMFEPGETPAYFYLKTGKSTAISIGCELYNKMSFKKNSRVRLLYASFHLSPTLALPAGTFGPKDSAPCESSSEDSEVTDCERIREVQEPSRHFGHYASLGSPHNFPIQGKGIDLALESIRLARQEHKAKVDRKARAKK